jgi:Ser/Thr protein kinase RdoA (MazF antagonist)
MKKIKIKKLILNNWNIKEIYEIKLIDKGNVNKNWLIKTKDKKYVFRQFNKEHTISNLKFELSYLLYLKDKKFPYDIPALLMTKSKKSFLMRGKDLFWLYPFIEGNHIDQSSKKVLTEIALMTTRYHDIIEKSKLENKKPKKKNFGREAIIKEIKEFVSKMPLKKNNRQKIFFKQSKKMVDILEKLDTKDYNFLKQYPIHRDLNPENLIWKKGRLTGIIDFENVGNSKDVLARDIAVIMQYFCKKNKSKFDIEKARFFIKEYKKHRKLQKEEIKILIDLIIATNIEDFAYTYYLIVNNPKRTKLSNLRKYSKIAQYLFDNKDKFKEELIKEYET